MNPGGLPRSEALHLKLVARLHGIQEPPAKSVRLLLETGPRPPSDSGPWLPEWRTAAPAAVSMKGSLTFLRDLKRAFGTKYLGSGE